MSLPLWRYGGKETCRVDIDFRDISVARSFMSLIVKWNSSLEEAKTNNIIKRIRKYAPQMPPIFSYGILAVSGYYTLEITKKYFETPSFESTVIFILLAYLINSIAWRFGMFLGKKAESYLDKLYEKCKQSKEMNTIYSVAYVIVLGVIDSISS